MIALQQVMGADGEGMDVDVEENWDLLMMRLRSFLDDSGSRSDNYDSSLDFDYDRLGVKVMVERM